jgi:hypothetical protein
MLIKFATAVLIALGPGQPHLLAQAQSQLAVTTPEQKVHLLFTLDGESKRELQQSLSACKSVEVRYIAELHKRRMLWPDLRFARTMVRNRALCDEKSGARALQRTVDGSIVASSSGMSDAAVLAFMSETGNISAFQDVKFRNDSYSVRVKAMLVTAPDRWLQTGVLAETRFEIR